VSKDFGETLTPVKNPGGFKGAHVSVRANRQQPDWVLALAKRPDCHTLDDYQIRCPSDLFVSKVRGAGRGQGQAASWQGRPPSEAASPRLGLPAAR
jgi:hypothetical protein